MSENYELSSGSLLNRCFKTVKSLCFLRNFCKEFLFFISADFAPITSLVILLSFHIVIINYRNEARDKFKSICSIFHLIILSYFRSIAFSNVFFSIITLLIKQRGPCGIIESQHAYSMPYVPIMIPLQLVFFALEIKFFETLWKRVMLILFTLLLTLVTIVEADCSLLQALISISLSYICHYIFLYIGFNKVHIINAVQFALGVLFLVYKRKSFIEPASREIMIQIFDGSAESIVFGLLLIRYHYVNKGFNYMQSPTDIFYELNAFFRSYARQTDSGNQVNFSVILKNGIFDLSCAILLLIVSKAILFALK